MKVVKPGRKQKGWAEELECTGEGNGGGGCGALLLVEECDIYVTRSHSYDCSSEEFFTFKCCECGVETDIHKLPGAVATRVCKRCK